jgi:ribosome-binding factor A
MSKAKRGATQGAVPRTRKKSGAANPPTQRQLRVAEEIRHVLSGVFTRGEFRDPDLAGQHVTVTEVRLSPDLKHATAFVARLGRPDIDRLLPALKRAAPYFRAQVAHELRLRVAADISFQPDTALEYAVHIDRVLHLPEVARDLTQHPKFEQQEDQAE